jgi:hypothetical protein
MYTSGPGGNCLYTIGVYDPAIRNPAIRQQLF